MTGKAILRSAYTVYSRKRGRKVALCHLFSRHHAINMDIKSRIHVLHYLIWVYILLIATYQGMLIRFKLVILYFYNYC